MQHFVSWAFQFDCSSCPLPPRSNYTRWRIWCWSSYWGIQTSKRTIMFSKEIIVCECFINDYHHYLPPKGNPLAKEVNSSLAWWTWFVHQGQDENPFSKACPEHKRTHSRTWRIARVGGSPNICWELRSTSLTQQKCRKNNCWLFHSFYHVFSEKWKQPERSTKTTTTAKARIKVRLT